MCIAQGLRSSGDSKQEPVKAETCNIFLNDVIFSIHIFVWCGRWTSGYIFG